MYPRIDKRKVKAWMDKRGVSGWNELGKRMEALPEPNRISTRSMYETLDSQNWTAKQLRAYCMVLECGYDDIVSIDTKPASKNAVALAGVAV